MKAVSATENQRRVCTRFPAVAEVTCMPMASGSASAPARGLMRNCSPLGAYIETVSRFRPGTHVIMHLIRWTAQPSGADEDTRPPSVCLAQVRWRRDLDCGPTAHYGMGIQYLYRHIPP